MEIESFILENTRLTSPFLCPELSLNLIDETCPLWGATEAELAALGLPDPFWAFCWAGGHALARFILDNPQVVRHRKVLDFGSGCGILAITACTAGASAVTAADLDPFARVAGRLNARENGVTFSTTGEDLLGSRPVELDVLLAGDMFYDPAFTHRAIGWFSELVQLGVRVLLGDPCRGNLPHGCLKLLATCKAPADVETGGTLLQETRIYEFGA